MCMLMLPDGTSFWQMGQDTKSDVHLNLQKQHPQWKDTQRNVPGRELTSGVDEPEATGLEGIAITSSSELAVGPGEPSFLRLRPTRSERFES